MPLPTLALCLEYPLALRGGVSVLVTELARRLGAYFKTVLVSPDEEGTVPAPHVRWRPGRSEELADRLAGHGVSLAHFHCGGVFAWGMRVPGRSTMAAVARRGIRCVSTVHRVGGVLDGFCGPHKPAWLKMALLPVAWIGKMDALSHVAAEICVSRHNEEILRRRYPLFAGRFRLIYHSRWDEDEPTVPVEREPVILHVGHLAHAKGQHVLVEAFAAVSARHPAWRLRLVGPAVEPMEEERLRAAIARSGAAERIELAGSRDDSAAVMRAAGIYAQPSLEEALGLALQEALGAGCAVVASDVGGIPELVAHEDNGLLVPPGDVSALAQALERMMADATLRDKLGARARPSMAERKMTASRMIEQHVKLYREILARP